MQYDRYEDDMDDAAREAGFIRGGKERSTLPVVRTTSRTNEKPLGVVFLIFRDETKRAILPNEITHIDTVKALFVRSFSRKLTLQYFDSPRVKIYVLDERRNVYYELEHVRDIQDRSVLKIQELDQFGNPLTNSCQSLNQPPSKSSSYTSSLASPQQVYMHEPRSPHSPQHYPPHYQNGHSPLPQHRPSPCGSPYRQQPSSLPQSPQRSGSRSSSRERVNSGGVLMNHRHSVPCVPNTAGGSTGSLHEHLIPHSNSYHSQIIADNQQNSGANSGSSTPRNGQSTDRMAKMEAQLASLTAWVQQSVVIQDSDRASTVSRNSIISDSSSIQTTGIDRKERQCLPPASLKPGLSDVSSSTPTQTPTPTILNSDAQKSLQSLRSKARELSSEVKQLRREQLAASETMRDMIYETGKELQRIIGAVPGANDQPVRAQRQTLNTSITLYQSDSQRVSHQLSDLESAVEDLRNGVVSKRCRVIPNDIEALALSLSQVSRSLAELKGTFPKLMDEMKSVMAGEMEIVVREETFLREEPEHIDNCLRRCKKLTGTLYTLKRLSTVQENQVPNPPNFHTNASPKQEDKNAILANIQAMVPDHDARMQSVEAAESSRERMKKIQCSQEALKFEKSLEIASKNLRETKPGEKLSTTTTPPSGQSPTTNGGGGRTPTSSNGTASRSPGGASSSGSSSARTPTGSSGKKSDGSSSTDGKSGAKEKAAKEKGAKLKEKELEKMRQQKEKERILREREKMKEREKERARQEKEKEKREKEKNKERTTSRFGFLAGKSKKSDKTSAAAAAESSKTADVQQQQQTEKKGQKTPPRKDSKDVKADVKFIVENNSNSSAMIVKKASAHSVAATTAQLQQTPIGINEIPVRDSDFPQRESMTTLTIQPAPVEYITVPSSTSPLRNPPAVVMSSFSPPPASSGFDGYYGRSISSPAGGATDPLYAQTNLYPTRAESIYANVQRSLVKTTGGSESLYASPLLLKSQILLERSKSEPASPYTLRQRPLSMAETTNNSIPRNAVLASASFHDDLRKEAEPSVNVATAPSSGLSAHYAMPGLMSNSYHGGQTIAPTTTGGATMSQSFHEENPAAKVITVAAGVQQSGGKSVSFDPWVHMTELPHPHPKLRSFPPVPAETIPGYNKPLPQLPPGVDMSKHGEQTPPQKKTPPPPPPRRSSRCFSVIPGQGFAVTSDGDYENIENIRCSQSENLQSHSPTSQQPPRGRGGMSEALPPLPTSQQPPRGRGGMSEALPPPPTSQQPPRGRGGMSEALPPPPTSQQPPRGRGGLTEALPSPPTSQQPPRGQGGMSEVLPPPPASQQPPRGRGGISEALPVPPGQQRSPRGGGMSRFEKDLMAGVYSNLNRPDLQEQNINLRQVVRSPEIRARAASTIITTDTKEKTSSSDSESTGSLESGKSRSYGTPANPASTGPATGPNGKNIVTHSKVVINQRGRREEQTDIY
ncbi:uncharacterized protein LOC141912207 [Tubulanus polymorphus]|uniref:uncharacterized protein LOC141912207 n=1 Tax=Tubulanus polymorphus TaxID=672921 RepID=UPI003DA64AEB